MPLSVSDRLEIMELASRACHATDHFLAEEWADLFTDDGVVTVGEDFAIRGRAALIEHVRNKRQSGVHNRHFTCNPVVDGDGDHATMSVYVVVHDLAAGLGAPSAIGEYRYEAVRVDGRWKVRRRDTVIVGGRSRVSR
jgi:hypothetical protein